MFVLRLVASKAICIKEACRRTDATKSVLQLQSKGGEGNLLRHGQDGHSRQIRGWIPSIPLTGGCVEGKTATCREEKMIPFPGYFSLKGKYFSAKYI